ncbi:hypothetical protein [Actinoplanes rectilineatus]|nr:hypothetical protein [Actinoplanes rectilineatus]
MPEPHHDPVRAVSFGAVTGACDRFRPACPGAPIDDRTVDPTTSGDA